MGRPSAERRPSLDRPTTDELGYIEKYEYGAARLRGRPAFPQYEPRRSIRRYRLRLDDGSYGRQTVRSSCRGHTGSSLNTVCCGAMTANSASDDCGVAPKYGLKIRPPPRPILARRNGTRSE